MKRSIGGLMAGALALAPTPLFAHAADRGHVLLLPTGHYYIGGALAVALSFIVLAVMPARPAASLFSPQLTVFALPVRLRFWTSLFSFVTLLVLLCIGFAGSRDPLSNPLPLTVWTLFWVGLTLLQGIAGNVWWWLSPWYAPSRLLRRGDGGIDLPFALGYWPAVVLFLGFAWFELVYPAPDDPARLATVLGVYYLCNLAAVIVFGHERWTSRGECFSVFLGMIAKLGIFEKRRDGKKWSVSLRPPGAKLVEAAPLPLSGALFLLLALSTVSFDGLMRTFFWLGLHGINPLEFPGRSEVVSQNTLGLFGMFLLLAGAFYAAVSTGARLAGKGDRAALAGRLVWSIIPISMAYHFSHYLTVLVVNGQYAIAAWSDPLMRGWDLFGTAGYHVQAGLIIGAQSAWIIWNLQAAAIIAGHLIAVLIAHVIAMRCLDDERAATRSQLLLALLMISYTVFGLWLLSSPTAA